ncbi:hypothetical protein Goarm_009746, partial [Gossypium armourianum]|nr:hypothetical protein [Gossypium armourianum]
MHAVESTFRGVIRSKIKGDSCQIRVQLDVQKPLRRGIFSPTGVKVMADDDLPYSLALRVELNGEDLEAIDTVDISLDEESPNEDTGDSHTSEDKPMENKTEWIKKSSWKRLVSRGVVDKNK